MDWDKMSNLYRGPSIHASYLVSGNNNIVQTTEKSMIPDKETIIMIPTVENSMTQDKENCQVYIKQGSLFPPI